MTKTQNKPILVRFMEALRVPREARKGAAGGALDVAKGALRVVGNSEVSAGAASVVTTGALMGVIALRSTLESKTGDDLLGLHLPPDPAEVREERVPNQAAHVLTGGERFATAKGVHMFGIQLLNVLNYGSGLISNAPIVPVRIRNFAAWTSQWVWGPLLGYWEARGHRDVTRPVADAKKGAHALTPNLVPDFA